MVDIWSATVRITPDVLHQELGGETVLLNLANENYFGLDAVGTRVWQVLTETQSANDVVTRLTEEYDVPTAQLRADVAKLITELAVAGLVSLGETV
jgi:Coenzyme PQQ synthesis protein D (PqqD)